MQQIEQALVDLARVRGKNPLDSGFKIAQIKVNYTFPNGVKPPKRVKHPNVREIPNPLRYYFD